MLAGKKAYKYWVTENQGIECKKSQRHENVLHLFETLLEEDIFYGRVMVAETFKAYLTLRTQSYFVERLSLMYEDNMESTSSNIFSKEQVLLAKIYEKDILEVTKYVKEKLKYN